MVAQGRSASCEATNGILRCNELHYTGKGFGDQVDQFEALFSKQANRRSSLRHLPERLLRPGPVREFIERLSGLDAEMAERARAAAAKGGRLVCRARVAPGVASVRLEVVPAEQPVARTRGTENLLVIRSRWYADHPIVIQGPGAGREVTATGLMTDLVAAAGRVAHRAGQGRRRGSQG